MAREVENREWLNDYPSLKQVKENNPFTVPVGYFDELSGRITSAIRLEELKSKMPLDGFTLPENYFNELQSDLMSRVTIEAVAGTDTGFTVPADYFAALTDNLQSRVAIDEALTAGTGFTVPDGYFDDLAGNIKSRIAVEELLSNDNNFTVPDGYFENLAGNIQSRIAVEEVMAEAEAGFTVPQGYFEQLNKNILSQTVGQETVIQKAKVVSIFRTTAFKYATAACLALMVGTGIFIQRFNDPEAVHNRSYLHKQLSGVSADEIQSYLETNLEPTDIQGSVATQGLPVDVQNLKDDLQEYSDNIQ